MNATYTSTLLAPLVQQFFTDRLMAQRNVSPRTVAAYRDTFRLLLVWFEQKLHKSPMRLVLTDLDVTRIAAFLDYLETERHNTIRSRNARFVALRSFLHFAALNSRSHRSVVGSTSWGVSATPGARELTITADGGGSNGSRVRLWKVELQKFADTTGLVLHVHHYPPGTSKWNKIEHRMFCHITQTGVRGP